MGNYAVSITKTVLFRGVAEEFSNVYNYQYDAALAPDDAERLIDAVVALERPVYANIVTFKTGRVWSAGGTPAANETIKIKDLTGTGSALAAQNIYRELCVVVNLDTGRNSSTGRKIYLRKFLHVGALPSGSSSIGLGTDKLAPTDKTPFLTYGNGIRRVTVTGTVQATLQAPGGQDIASDAVVSVLDYLRIRQFHQ